MTGPRILEDVSLRDVDVLGYFDVSLVMPKVARRFSGETYVLRLKAKHNMTTAR